MLRLYHHPFDPFSRAVRLSLAEQGLEAELVEERPWERRRDFLVLNPAGTLPVLVDDGVAVCGSYAIHEYLDETRTAVAPDRRLMPADPRRRAEVRRLLDWFDRKFHEEVTCNLVNERVIKRYMASAQGGGAPDAATIHAGRTNIRYHLRYTGHLIRTRNWLAGDSLTVADLAAAAHLSCIDYLGDVPWVEDETAKNWYARVKSRPAFRALLAEGIPGMPPAPAYADLDF